LQIGYDKQRIEAGILLVNAKRSNKSPFGTTADLIKAEIETLYPTIHLPVAACLISTGEPILYDEEGNPYGSVSVSQDDNPTAEKAAQGLTGTKAAFEGIIRRPSKRPTRYSIV
jgi:hypothetical protein